MARFFDAQAALAEIQGSPIPPIRPTSAVETGRNSTNSTNRVPPDTDAFEERAAIIEFDGGLTRREAEDLAAKAQGYRDVLEFRTAHESND